MKEMNKKTFTLAVLFLALAFVWFATTVYWYVTRSNCVSVFDLLVGVMLVMAGAAMVYNEFHKKKRRHIDDVNKHQIP